MYKESLVEMRIPVEELENVVELVRDGIDAIAEGANKGGIIV